jgi:lysozyme family protein
MFDRAYSKLLIVEGGYSNRKTDRGGETFCGISRVHHPDWPGWAMVDGHLQRGRSKADLTKSEFLMAQVKSFYHLQFWNALWCDQLPPRIAGELFDSAVNCSPARAVRWLQTAVNMFAAQPILAVDGVMGKQTVTKTRVQIENFGDVHLLKVMNGEQYKHYTLLIERAPEQRGNLRGWLTRVWEDC